MDNKEMNFTFSGTLRGMTIAQQFGVMRAFMRLEGYKIIHHGGATGADEQAHTISERFLFERHIHWSMIADKRMKVTYRAADDVEYAPLPPLKRNRVMIDASTWLIAAPATRQEMRCGTWATVRYARERKINITLVFPDGSVSEERYVADRQVTEKGRTKETELQPAAESRVQGSEVRNKVRRRWSGKSTGVAGQAGRRND